LRRWAAASTDLAMAPPALLIASNRKQILGNHTPAHVALKPRISFVPGNAEKIYSIFEPHTDLIKRGKVQTPLEFGHKVFLAESAQGLMNGKTSEMWSCHQSTPFHRVL
jgi:hypothetical protein